MTWEEIVAGGKFVGGDAETTEDGVVYRGPISEIVIEADSFGASNKLVHVKNLWVAKLGKDGVWRHVPNPGRLFWQASSLPRESSGRVIATLPFLGHAVLFPKDGSKLDPAKVVGLPEQFLTGGDS